MIVAAAILCRPPPKEPIRLLRHNLSELASPTEVSRSFKAIRFGLLSEQRKVVICFALRVVGHFVTASLSQASSCRLHPSGAQFSELSVVTMSVRGRHHFQQRASPPRLRACLKSDTQSSASVSSPSPWGAWCERTESQSVIVAAANSASSAAKGADSVAEAQPARMGVPQPPAEEKKCVTHTRFTSSKLRPVAETTPVATATELLNDQR